jgi:hypothetical protein
MDDEPRKTKTELPGREDRRKAALKANMARRKAQARARAVDLAARQGSHDGPAAASGEAEHNNKND